MTIAKEQIQQIIADNNFTNGTNVYQRAVSGIEEKVIVIVCYILI